MAKFSKIVQNCPYWCKVVQMCLELSKLFLVINIFSTFSQLYNFQLQKIHIDSYFDSFRMKKDLNIFGQILEISAIVVRCSAQFASGGALTTVL